MNEQRERRDNLDCAIAQDLLPLYNDGVVSTATGQALQRHLEHCKACRREYEDLREILPVKQEDFGTTKERFLALERKLERRRIARVFWIVLAVAALLAGGWFVLTQLDLRPVDQSIDEIVRSYRYEDDRGTHFLILYRETVEQHGSSRSGVTHVEQEGDTCLLQESWKSSILGTKQQREAAFYTDICLEEQGIARGDAIQTLLYQGKVAWTQKDNGDDPIPAYVPLYFAFHEADYTGAPAAEGTMDIYVDEGYVQANYRDGKIILWDLDGTVLYEGYPGEKAAAAHQ